MNSVLLDTSFCIRLLNSNDVLHKNAVEYFTYFLDNQIEMYLSSIVISEYSVKDDVNNLPLQQMKIIPFDDDDGRVAGDFYSFLHQNKQHTQGLDRLVVKDDCKLVAQIYNRKIDAYITKDRKSFNQFFYPLQREKGFKIELLDMSVPLNGNALAKAGICSTTAC